MINEQYKTRYFNKIEYIEKSNLLKKSSTNMEKIKAEYDYYYELPPLIQKYFVQPINFEINNKTASYYVQKIETSDLAKVLINDELTEEMFQDVINSIKLFQLDSENIKMDHDESIKENKEIVLNKVQNRLSLLDSHGKWHQSQFRLKLLKNNITTKRLFDKLSVAFHDNFYNRKTYFKKISHGDLCFSNILWDQSNKIIKFIDPKGYPFVIMDEYYDIAKLSHSLLGRYDDIVYEKYKIENNNIVFDRENNKKVINIFEKYLENASIDYRYLRIMEASIFLSMLINHIDDEKRVFAFILNCDRILKELGY